MTLKTHKKIFFIATLLAPIVAGGTVLFCIILGQFLHPAAFGSMLPTLDYLSENPLNIVYLLGIFTAFGYIVAFPAVLLLGLPVYIFIVKRNISIFYYFLIALMVGSALGYMAFFRPNNLIHYNFFGTMLIGMLPSLTVATAFHLIIQLAANGSLLKDYRVAAN